VPRRHSGAVLIRAYEPSAGAPLIVEANWLWRAENLAISRSARRVCISIKTFFRTIQRLRRAVREGETQMPIPAPPVRPTDFLPFFIGSHVLKAMHLCPKTCISSPAISSNASASRCATCGRCYWTVSETLPQQRNAIAVMVSLRRRRVWRGSAGEADIGAMHRDAAHRTISSCGHIPAKQGESRGH
jgi:hypothetical protein